MRIIAGKFRSRLLRSPPGDATRPTSDRLRETLFNVLAPRIEAAAFLDLYAGSGAVGLEALSREARSVEFVERNRSALAVLRANLAQLGIDQGTRLAACSVENWLRKAAAAPGRNRAESHGQSSTPVFDLVFLDPPWDLAGEYEIALQLLGGPAAGVLAPGALVVAEHRRKQQLESRYGKLERNRLLEQGDAALSFYAVVTGGPA